MRWRYPDPADRVEAAERDAVLRTIDAFWTAFIEFAPTVKFERNADVSRAVKFMSRHLKPINESLMWEFGPATSGDGHRLAITPENEFHLRPLAEAVVSKAPQLPGWQFFPFRVADGLEDAEAAVKGRVGGSLENATARVAAGTENLVDVTVFGVSTNVAFVAVETLAGEQILNEWIAELTGRRSGLLSRLLGRSASHAESFPIVELRERLLEAIARVQAGLPAIPFHESAPPYDTEQTEEEFQMVQFSPRKRPDYHTQQDLLVCMTRRPELSLAMLSSLRFCSRRFSRCNETFCYIKIEHAGFDDVVSSRSGFESLVEKALRQNSLGTIFAGGTGLRYMYTHLVLTDVERAVAELRKALEGTQLPARSWLLFPDYDLIHEWLGLHAESPAPPLPLSGRIQDRIN